MTTVEIPLITSYWLPHLQTACRAAKQQVSADDKALTRVNGTVVDLLGRKLPVEPGDVGMVTLKLTPIGMHAPIVTIHQLLILVKQLQPCTNKNGSTEISAYTAWCVGQTVEC